MITIVLNGENSQLDKQTNIEQLLVQLGLSEKRLAIEVNLHIIPRSDFATFTLSDEDKVEIVQAIGGGSL